MIPQCHQNRDMQKPVLMHFHLTTKPRNLLTREVMSVPVNQQGLQNGNLQKTET